MAADYNSELIDRLYTTTDSRLAAKFVDEMAEINDPIFIFPILSAFQKFRSSSQSHYFISALMQFQHDRIFDLISPLIPELSHYDIGYTLPLLAQKKYNDMAGLSRIKAAFEKALSDPEVLEYDLQEFADFYRSRGELAAHTEGLQTVFQNPAVDNGARRIAFRYLMNLDVQKEISRITENFPNIKTSRADVIIAKEIAQGEKADLLPLREYISKNGSSAAKEIIHAAEAVEKNRQHAKTERAVAKFKNADLLSEIVTLRENLDRLTQSDARFKTSFFKPFEKLYQQLEPAIDQKQIVSNAIDLRGCIQAINSSALNHGLSEEDARKLIPGIENLTGSLNKLHLFLLARGVPVDVSFFGFRPLNQALSKIAHPEQSSESDRLTVLKRAGLAEDYVAGDWPSMNRRLLSMYRNALSAMYAAALSSKSD